MWVKHGKTIRHPKVARNIWVETITHGVVCSCFNHMKWGCSLQVAWPERPDPRLRVGPGHDRPYVSAYEEYIYVSYKYKQSVCVDILYYIILYLHLYLYLYYIILYDLILYYIILYYIVLYYIIYMNLCSCTCIYTIYRY